MRNFDIALQRGRFFCSAGSPKKEIFSPVLRADGIIELVSTGFVDTDEEIESQVPSCSLENLLIRFQNGDQEALSQMRGVYMDLTDQPSTYAEYLQAAINAEQGFDKLPVEVKRKYDNNWRLWLMQAGSKEWFSDLGIHEKSESEVKTDESEQ